MLSQPNEIRCDHKWGEVNHWKCFHLPLATLGILTEFVYLYDAYFKTLSPFHIRNADFVLTQTSGFPSLHIMVAN